jgi:ribosomal protein S21
MAVIVIRKKKESFESLMRRFKKAYITEGIDLEIYERQHYVKPSKRRRVRKRKPWGR